MKHLKIAEGLTFPIDAVTQTMAAIGRRGAGKTYLATMMAEQMLDVGAQFIGLDPVGNWWGLRVDADGKSKGKEIFVIGGEHGDVPLVPEAGARIARLLVEKRISAILDLTNFRIGERKRFAAEFAEEFFHLKKSQRSPVHLAIEEAQVFIPQRPMPDEARMLGAFESIVRIGRNYGIGSTLITQRPQSVNKEVLSQVECLCVLQVNGTHERKALEDWVQEAGADRTLVGELPGLHRGEGYVWSPSWLRIFKKVRFNKKTTLDTSATPEVGHETMSATLSEVDVEALKTDLSEVIKKAQEDDPKALKRRIAELERQKPIPAVKAEIKTVERAVLKDSQISRLQAESERLQKIADKCKEVALGLAGESQAIAAALRQAQSRVSTPPAPVRTAVPERAPIHHSNGTGEPLGRCARALLTALAQYPEGRTKNQIAILSGYSVTSGGFANALASIRSHGFAVGPSDHIRITPEGVTALGSFDPLPTGLELLAYWKRELPRCEAKILGVLENTQAPLSKEELGKQTGYSDTSGGFANALSRLRTLELITRGSEIRLSEDFFQ